MSSYRKKLSGAANRKRTHDKIRNETELLEKTPKLDVFFCKKSKSYSTVVADPDDPDIPDANPDLRFPHQSAQSGTREQSSSATIHSDADVGESRLATNSYILNEEQEIPNREEVDDQHACENSSIRQRERCDVVIATQEDSRETPSCNATTTESSHTVIVVSDDPAEWIVNETTRDILLERGITQNSDKDFASSKRHYPDHTRYMTKSLFVRTLANGQTQPRSWLVYSESRGAVFCAPCKLFEKTSTTLATIGYDDWKNVHQRLREHENSFDHRSATTMLLQRSSTNGSIDKTLIDEIQRQTEYWQNVIKRVVAVIKTLAISGLAFRGSTERFDASVSSGNYIAALKLIADFDPFLAEHIKLHGNQGRGSTSYLSSTICDELIGLMEKQVSAKIISETKEAKYYAISVDSTPDISHVDQLTFILRYVNKEGCPEERFMKFIPNTGHKGEEMIAHVLSTLEEYDLDILNCRGQSYDNASNMSGIYSSLQARVKAINPLVEYVPCAAHTLNLVGKCAVESCPGAIRFFTVLQHLYTFFSASTHRWDILVSHLNLNRIGPVVKNLSQTRWSAHSDACKSLCQSWDAILDALTEISDRVDEKAETRAEASGLLNSLNNLENCFVALVWNEILSRFHSVSKALQSIDIELPTVVELYKYLIEYVDSLRDKFDIYEAKAKEKSDVHEYVQDTRRPRRRRTRFNENEENAHTFCGRENLKVNTFFVILDRLRTELTTRSKCYIALSERFNFLTELAIMNSQSIASKATELQSAYPEDLEDSFGVECEHLGAHLRTLQIEKISALNLCKMLFEKNLQSVYPNVNIALRMLLSMPATNCSAERSFSVLRRVKNYLRSTISQHRLNALAILCIEADLTRRMKFDDLIRDFARAKARRVNI